MSFQGNDLSDLRGKVAVVTGASKGIGAATARLLSTYGCSVVINYLDSAAAAEDVVRHVRRFAEAISVRSDVSTFDGVNDLFSETLTRFGKVDILINNAGTFGRLALKDVTVAKYASLFDLNVLGYILCSQRALVAFDKTGGSIVNVGSMASREAPAGSMLYNASKAAVDAITSSLAKELKPANIRVNSVNPGLVNTEGLRATRYMNYLKRRSTQSESGRMLEPDEVARAIAYFASELPQKDTGVIFELSDAAMLATMQREQ